MRDRLASWQLFLSSFDMKVNYKSGQEPGDSDVISRLCIDIPNYINEFFWCNLLVEDLERLEDGKYLMKSPRMLKEIFMTYHDDPNSGGHDGYYKTYYKIKRRFFWNSMAKQIREYVKTCQICQINTFKYLPKTDFIHISQRSQISFETVHIDFG